MKKTISVIITCYNEEENIPILYKRLDKIFKKLPYIGEFIYIDNRSIDASGRVLRNLAKKDKRVKVILMSRNFGSPQPSFLAGLNFATGDAAVFLHGDIQDPPEMIPDFIKKWKQGYDVVYGIRKKREGYGIIWNFYYKSFYYFFKKLSYIDMPLNAGEFSLVNKDVMDELQNFSEYDYFLRGLRAYVGFNQVGIEYVRDPRHYGKSVENIFTSLYWAKTLIINFSLKPLELISRMAFLIMLLTFIFVIINIVAVLLFRNSPRGIPTIVILILFLGGVQLLSLSVIAEYLARIFLEIKGRPRFIIKETINIKKTKKLQKYA